MPGPPFTDITHTAERYYNNILAKVDIHMVLTIIPTIMMRVNFKVFSAGPSRHSIEIQPHWQIRNGTARRIKGKENRMSLHVSTVIYR